MTRSTATGSRRKSPAHERRRDDGLPADLAKLLRRALPEGLVELQGPADESWLGEVEAKVRSKLVGLPGAELAFERSPDPQRLDMDDLELPTEDADESSRSYHLFFIAPTAPWASSFVATSSVLASRPGASRSRARPWLRTLRAADYRAHLVFLALPSADVAVARVAERVRRGGHSVPEDVVRRRCTSGLKNLFANYINAVDTWQIYDNSGTIDLDSSPHARLESR